jgi:hypothetical protein
VARGDSHCSHRALRRRLHLCVLLEHDEMTSQELLLLGQAYQDACTTTDDDETLLCPVCAAVLRGIRLALHATAKYAEGGVVPGQVRPEPLLPEWVGPPFGAHVGARVRFLGATDDQVQAAPGGADPRQWLTVGNTYALERVRVHAWHTLYYLDGCPEDVWFNSVCFALADAGHDVCDATGHVFPNVAVGTRCACGRCIVRAEKVVVSPYRHTVRAWGELRTVVGNEQWTTFPHDEPA